MGIVLLTPLRVVQIYKNIKNDQKCKQGWEALRKHSKTNMLALLGSATGKKRWKILEDKVNLKKSALATIPTYSQDFPSLEGIRLRDSPYPPIPPAYSKAPAPNDLSSSPRRANDPRKTTGERLENLGLPAYVPALKTTVKYAVIVFHFPFYH